MRPLPSEPGLNAVSQLEREHGMVKGDLLRVMQIESGVCAAEVDPVTRASGCIRFLPSVLRNCGFLGTPEEFNTLPLLNQIPQVRRYLARFLGKLHTLGDTYASVFWPIAVGQADDYVISGDSHSRVYQLNAVLDLNGDGRILKGELDPSCRRFLRGTRWRDIEKLANLTPTPEVPVFGTPQWLQSKLQSLGYYHGEVDGLVGAKSIQAIREFQQKHPPLIVDGIAGPRTMNALRAG